jgi:hypothetical protein
VDSNINKCGKFKEKKNKFFNDGKHFGCLTHISKDEFHISMGRRGVEVHKNKISVFCADYGINYIEYLRFG